jgi:hypothetical protein
MWNLEIGDQQPPVGVFPNCAGTPQCLIDSSVIQLLHAWVTRRRPPVRAYLWRAFYLRRISQSEIGNRKSKIPTGRFVYSGCWSRCDPPLSCISRLTTPFAFRSQVAAFRFQVS